MAPELHPDTAAALEEARNLAYALDDMIERIDGIRSRRPSPSGRVIAEADGLGRLVDLFIAPGTIANTTNSQELVADVMAAIRESTYDAAYQHKTITQTAAILQSDTGPEPADHPGV
ncbi:hypothetical protein [Nocardia sp. NBC_00416]|uniref:hypothetical protein n=1 Tax=Nocardia sp. NBC_00416 TaxID=2975991 RepID=UPI002E2493B4